MHEHYRQQEGKKIKVEGKRKINQFHTLAEVCLSVFELFFAWHWYSPKKQTYRFNIKFKYSWTFLFHPLMYRFFQNYPQASSQFPLPQHQRYQNIFPIKQLLTKNCSLKRIEGTFPDFTEIEQIFSIPCLMANVVCWIIPLRVSREPPSTYLQNPVFISLVQLSVLSLLCVSSSLKIMLVCQWRKISTLEFQVQFFLTKWLF